MAGGARYGLDGSRSPAAVRWAYSFDSAIATPDSRFVVIYQRLGTKALLLKGRSVVRELNRSFYHADVYEYPICLVPRGDRTLLIHCPDDYNRLEVEDAETGERLTQRQSKASDFFHSRLRANPSGTRLLSAGWVWHPLDAVVFFDIDLALREPQHLDRIDWHTAPSRHVGLVEENSACWQDENFAIVTGGEDQEDEEAAAEHALELRLRPNGVIVYDTSNKTVRSACVLEQPAGTVMPIGDTHIIAFYRHPRLVRLNDGHVEKEWPDIASGEQLSSILLPTGSLPPLALDVPNARFAVAASDGIRVVRVAIS
ncbi:MAG TPA: hypothetical protein VHU41_17445 [Thermoanaerobaculia bacterium]|nr:hypothetical protein [Thermoanaerobaculia bacterium]